MMINVDDEHLRRNKLLRLADAVQFAAIQDDRRVTTGDITILCVSLDSCKIAAGFNTNTTVVAKMARMPITMSNSIKVNPDLFTL